VTPEALEAAIALQLLCPQIPLIFMGEEDASTSPFQFFTDHHGELADAVREGRRKEFATFATFSDPARRAAIPDPNASETFERSRPQPDPERGAERRALYRRVLALRSEHIVPRLAGAKAIGAQAIGPSAVLARWRLADRAILTLASNLGPDPCAMAQPPRRLIFETPGGAEALKAGQLGGHTTLAFLE
jgi:1,4-alpha-glucan branching enzyme